ncbi:Enteropeptidase like protein [Argiope bruennichi]|uniref:Enteropeptidase like protein n=1 Tax=Argiope bruennichi TaxID=94029 RepID=A0A8T0EBR9_ARGBR|nr:Enteropeptidase like protein [Argiope bruennichi]
MSHDGSSCKSYIKHPTEKERLDHLAFTSFPEDYLPYASNYHQRAGGKAPPYLVWDERRPRRGRSCCSTTALVSAIALIVAAILAVVAISVYLGVVTNLFRSPVLSLSGKFRVSHGDDFVDELLNTTSLQFLTKAESYQAMVENAFLSSSLEPAFIAARIYAFRPLDVYENEEWISVPGVEQRIGKSSTVTKGPLLPPRLATAPPNKRPLQPKDESPKMQGGTGEVVPVGDISSEEDKLHKFSYGQWKPVPIEDSVSACQSSSSPGRGNVRLAESQSPASPPGRGNVRLAEAPLPAPPPKKPPSSGPSNPMHVGVGSVSVLEDPLSHIDPIPLPPRSGRPLLLQDAPPQKGEVASSIMSSVSLVVRPPSNTTRNRTSESGSPDRNERPFRHTLPIRKEQASYRFLDEGMVGEGSVQLEPDSVEEENSSGSISGSFSSESQVVEGSVLLKESSVEYLSKTPSPDDMNSAPENLKLKESSVEYTKTDSKSDFSKDNSSEMAVPDTTTRNIFLTESSVEYQNSELVEERTLSDIYINQTENNTKISESKELTNPSGVIESVLVVNNSKENSWTPYVTTEFLTNFNETINNITSPDSEEIFDYIGVSSNEMEHKRENVLNIYSAKSDIGFSHQNHSNTETGTSLDEYDEGTPVSLNEERDSEEITFEEKETTSAILYTKYIMKLAENAEDARGLHYREQGFLMVRKEGAWGKLCLDNLHDSRALRLKLDELGEAVCSALTFRGVSESKRIQDIKNSNDTYYVISNEASTPNKRSSAIFHPSVCESREVMRVECGSLECGLRPMATSHRRRIVGGQSASSGSWPWQVALYKEGDFQCGAVLISDTWLISAGHCFYSTLNAHWVARLGLLRRGSELSPPSEQVRRVAQIFLHPNYEDKGFINDIALLRLDRPVLFSDYLRPVCLPTAEEDPGLWHGRQCSVVGWGKLYEIGHTFPDSLQEVRLPVISTEECRKRILFLTMYHITDNMFCAGYERGGRDACLGDSGGPLMCQREDGRWILLGVTSNGDGCGRPGRPGVYTKVANYLDWIHKIIEAKHPIQILPDSCEGVRCRLGRCIAPYKMCDGRWDCSEGKDEDHCFE